MTVGLNQDTLGGILKVCITRYLFSIYNTIYTLSTILSILYPQYYLYSIYNTIYTLSTRYLHDICCPGRAVAVPGARDSSDVRGEERVQDHQVHALALQPAQHHHHAGGRLRALGLQISAYHHLQGPKEFLECVSHIRLLSWLLLGAMSHTMMAASKVQI